MHSRYGGLERFGVQRRPTGRLVHADADRAEQLEVGMEAGECVDPVGPDRFGRAVPADDDRLGRDSLDLRRHAHRDLARLDPVLEVGT